MDKPVKLPPGLFQRGDTYYISYYEGGKRVRRAVGQDFGTALQALHRKRASGAPPSQGLTFAQVTALYVADLADRHADKPRTAVSARSGLAAPIRAFGQVPLQALTDEHWRDFTRARREQVSQATVARDARYVKACVRWALKQGLAQKLPFEIVIKLPTKRKGRHLTKAQIKQLLDTADSRTRPVLFLALNAGLRRQEITTLLWRDVDLSQGIVHVRAKPRWSPKDHAERAIPLTPQAVTWLKNYRDTLPANDGGSPVCQQDPQTGKPWNVSSGQLNHHVAQVFKRAGLYKPDLKPGLHLLRASYATLMLEGGATLETVRELMGHCSVTVTERYLFTTPDAKRAALKALDFLT